jgi:hypothetical protein
VTSGGHELDNHLAQVAIIRWIQLAAFPLETVTNGFTCDVAWYARNSNAERTASGFLDVGDRCEDVALNELRVVAWASTEATEPTPALTVAVVAWTTVE